jgi:4-hydroxy 2-oxovalerate aldolase
MVSVLDCTFRDGGYYCDWDFEQSLVQRYLDAIDASGVEIVELGFRYFPREKYLGPFAYSTDDYLSSLSLSSRMNFSVMVDAKELIGFHGGVSQGIKKLFNKSENSPVDIVRIAVNVVDADKTQIIATCLRELGYRVILNLMQAGKAELSELRQIAGTVNSWKLIEVLYFADSLGNMTPDSVDRVVDALAEEWEGPLGIHTHDNKRNALVNSLSALDRGVTFVVMRVYAQRTLPLFCKCVNNPINRIRSHIPQGVGKIKNLYQLPTINCAGDLP